MTTKAQLEEWSQNPNVRRMLDLISYTEGTRKHGYYTKFGGGRWEDLSDHPNKIWGKTGDGATTATGRYQFLGGTWKELKDKYKFEDFGARNQDLGAIALIARRGAIQDVINGDVDTAIKKLSPEWASLPYHSSKYQNHKKLQDVMGEWKRLGGDNITSPYQSTPQQDKQMQPPVQETSFIPMTGQVQTPPQTLADQMANFGKTDANPLIDDFTKLNNTFTQPVEAQQPKVNYRNQFQQQLASAFGIQPQVKDGLPDYIGDLVKSIYDQV